MKVPIAGVLFLVLVTVLGAQSLMLQPAQTVSANQLPLNPGGQAIPCVADWNGDGLPDLVVGYQPAFKVAVYLNSGSATEPRFGTFSNLQAGGADIYLPSGGCGSPAPWVCDYDGDGKRDLLVGAGADGKVWFYRNTGTDDSPVLASGVAVRLGGGDLSVGARATPYTCDWDEDGLPDLLSGDAGGYVHLFRNVGTRQSPAYTNDVLVQAGGAALNLGARSTVRLCDWDADGIKDLVGGGSDKAAWCKKIGGNASPVFNSPVRLQAPGPGSGLANIDTGYRMRIELVDWNQDGVPDLLVGNWDGYIYLYEGYWFLLRNQPLPVETRCVLEWNSAPFLRYNVLAGSSPDHLADTVGSNLLSGGKRTCWTNLAAGDRQFFRVQLSP